MSRDESSAKERAEQARQQAEEARRSAARHAAARRAVQDSARRRVPDRRPPALSRKPGLEFRGGGITVDPTLTRTRPTPPDPEVAPTSARQETPPTPATPSTDNGSTARTRPTTPARRAQDRPQPPATLRTLPPVARPRPPAATPPDTNVTTSAPARVEAAPEPDLDEPTEQPPRPTEPEAAAPTAQEPDAVERLGALTGLPTDIPALPDPPSQDAPSETGNAEGVPAADVSVADVSVDEPASIDEEPAHGPAAAEDGVEAVAGTEDIPPLPTPPIRMVTARDLEAAGASEAPDDEVEVAEPTADDQPVDIDEDDAGSVTGADEDSGPEASVVDDEAPTLVVTQDAPVEDDADTEDAGDGAGEDEPALVLPLPPDRSAAPDTPEPVEGGAPAPVSLSTMSIDVSLPTSDEDPTLVAEASHVEPSEDDDAAVGDDDGAGPEGESEGGDDARADAETGDDDPAAEDSTAADTADDESADDHEVEDGLSIDGADRTVDLSTVVDQLPSAADAPQAMPERPWIRLYPPGVPDTYRYPLVPMTRLLDDAAQDFPDATAVQFLGTETSYRALGEQVDRLATALLQLGLGRGDRVGVVLPWSPQLVLVLHACWRAGLVAVVCDPDDGPEVVLRQIETAAPTALVVIDTTYPALAASRDQLASVQHVVTTGLLDVLPAIRAKVQAVKLRLPAITIPAEDGVLSLNDILAQAPAATPQVELAVDETTAVVVFDGDNPVALSHLNMIAASFQARLWIPDVQAGKESVVLAGSPASAFVLTAGLGQAMLSAATLVLPEPRPGAAARVVDDMRPSLLVGTDAGLTDLLAPDSKRRDLTSIRVTLSAAPPSEPAMGAAMRNRTGGRFRTSVSGQSVGGMVAAQPVYGESRTGIQGLPITDTEVAVAGAGPDGVGTLVARGPQVPGDDDTWVSTGYLGHIDERGQVKVVGPADRVVTHSGGTSDPTVLATALRRTDGVLDAMVRTEVEDGDLIMTASVMVSDDTLDEGRLTARLSEVVPNQAPPGRWTITVVTPPEEAVEGADATPGAESATTESAEAVESDRDVDPADSSTGADAATAVDDGVVGPLPLPPR
ncbi:AMP-binding protein [Euzebya rosea]|uniref:AMP-binding protein n=1 Tax=Euzebya rosea TaxID=2052804 RepID=UPI000D3EB4BA|nr:AMP-binding protein [Euzebya rosea]